MTTSSTEKTWPLRIGIPKSSDRHGKRVVPHSRGSGQTRGGGRRRGGHWVVPTGAHRAGSGFSHVRSGRHPGGPDGKLSLPETQPSPVPAGSNRQPVAAPPDRFQGHIGLSALRRQGRGVSAGLSGGGGLAGRSRSMAGRRGGPGLRLRAGRDRTAGLSAFLAASLVSEGLQRRQRIPGGSIRNAADGSAAAQAHAAGMGDELRKALERRIAAIE
jgi:hypothetical protein